MGILVRVDAPQSWGPDRRYERVYHNDFTIGSQLPSGPDYRAAFARLKSTLVVCDESVLPAHALVYYEDMSWQIDHLVSGVRLKINGVIRPETWHLDKGDVVTIGQASILFVPFP